MKPFLSHSAPLSSSLAARLEDSPFIGTGATQGSGQLDESGRDLRLLARTYLDHLLNAERAAAADLILKAVKSGVNVRDVYLGVFQPCLYEVGRLWQLNLASVAQEHYCTAATQQVMSRLYPYIFSMTRKDRKMVATCVSGELHEIGARMVADFFEMDGWDTYYLGANAPVDAILSSLADRSADVLAVSATLTSHVGRARELVQAVKSSPLGKNVRVMVGGWPFLLSPGLWRDIGADATAADARQALVQAEELLVRA